MSGLSSAFGEGRSQHSIDVAFCLFHQASFIARVESLDEKYWLPSHEERCGRLGGYILHHVLHRP